MTQKDEYGAFQPVVDLARKWGLPIGSKQEAAPAKVDTSWHDDMVRKATASFTKPQSKAAADPKLGQGKKKAAVKKKAAPAKKRQ